MERLRRMTRFWNWLPAFRSVAENESVNAAAKALHISPSALSRSVRLLEEELGYPLFTRRGRNLTLNERGRDFLVFVRAAMRQVDDGLSAAAGDAAPAPVFISTIGALEADVLLALDGLSHQHPTMLPSIRGSSRNIAADLSKGQLDLAFLSVPPVRREVRVLRLGMLSNGIYCGEGHPLFGSREVTVADVAAHAFVEYREERRVPEAPQEFPHDVRRIVDRPAAAAAECRSGRWLAVLPDRVATSEGRRLHRLSIDLAAQTPIFAAHRSSVDAVSRGRVDAIVAAIVESVAGSIAAIARVS